MLLPVVITDTITLGAVIIAAIGAMIGLYRVALGARLSSDNLRLRLRVQNLEGVIDDRDRTVRDQETRLYQLGAEKDAAVSGQAACEATIETLQKQIDSMPKYQEFMDYGREMMAHVDTAAGQRQKEILSEIVGELRLHDNRVTKMHEAAEERTIDRHSELLAIQREMLEELRALRKDSA